MARGDVIDFGNPFDPQQRKLDGTFNGPKPLDSIWDVPKSEGGGWLSAPVDRRNGAEVAKHGAGGGVGPVGTLVGCLVIIAIFAALGFVLIG